MDFRTMAQKLLNKASAAGFNDAEIYFEEDTGASMNIFESAVNEYTSNIGCGLSFRGIIDGCMGYASTETMSDDAFDFLLKKARENARVLDTKDEEVLCDRTDSIEHNGIIGQIDTIDFDWMKTTSLKIEKDILAFDKSICAVDDVAVSKGQTTIYVAGSGGLHRLAVDEMMTVYASARCKKDGQIKTAEAHWQGKDLSTFDANKLANSAASKALSKLGAKSLSSGVYAVVLDAEAATDLMAYFFSCFSADSVHKGLSLLEEKVGEKIFSDCINIRDEGTVSHSGYTIPFDAEGEISRSCQVVENGVLMSFLHNLRTAKKDRTLSTGNAARGGHTSSIGIGPKHFYIVPGNHTSAELIDVCENGLYITEVSGLHAGANAISGDFSLLCEGFTIKNHQIGRPVEQITMAGNYMTLMKNIAQIGSDIYTQPAGAWGSFASPSVLIRQLAISGI